MDKLKTLFDIRSEDINEQATTLLLEAGQDYCSFAFLSEDQKRISRLGYVSFDSFETEQSLNSILDQLNTNKVGKVVVGSAFPQALFVPEKLFRNSYTLLDVIYDQPSQEYCHDVIGEWQIINLYSLPRSIYEMFARRFDSIRLFHVYTPALKIYNGFAGEHQINIHFNTQDFRVLVKSGRQVKLVQTYHYQSPLDVVYYLLKICYEFGLDQASVYVILSGLVEVDSALYKEIHQYFLELHFAQPTALKIPDHQHPHYYFTSLYNLAACVS